MSDYLSTSILAVFRLCRGIVRHHVLTLGESFPNSRNEIPVFVTVIRLSHVRDNRLRCLLGMILGDAPALKFSNVNPIEKGFCLQEKMMDDMILNNVVQHVLANPSEFAVHCGHGALQEGSRLGFILRYFRVGVMKISNGHPPVIDPHVWLQVKQCDRRKSNLCACIPDSHSGHSNTNVGEKDEV